MRDRFFSLLGIEQGEESMVSELLMQSIFLGIFFGAFDISAHSLFLSIFDEKMMARGYVVSGIAGILLTTAYTWLQSRMQFRNFAILNLVAVTSFTLVLWLAVVISPVKWIVFTVFIMLGPLNILAMLGFWGTAGRLFTLRQGKRLFGLVDAGLIIGIIISCYTIPVLLSFDLGSHNIILISAISVLIATIFQFIIRGRFSSVPVHNSEKDELKNKSESIIKIFLKDPYTRVMAGFIALSMMTAFFVQYSFMAVTREQYPSAEDMARFLGIFTGSMMIFTLLIKLLVFSYLIRNYGLKICLTISPVLIALFTAIAITVGMLMGYTPEAASGFIIFFLLLALSRLFSKALKDSIESPSFKVIYQTINEKIRYNVQSGMDGTVNEIAALSSGLLLAGLGALSFVKLIHFSWVLFIIITLWLFVSIRLYKEYRKSIRKALEPVLIEKSIANVPEQKELKSRFLAETAFRNNYFNLVSGNYSELESIQSPWFLKKIIDFSEKKNDKNLIPVLRKIATGNNIDQEIRQRSSGVLHTLERIQQNISKEEEKLSAARKTLLDSRLPQTTEILRLLRDNSLESKRIGIFIIGKFKLADLLSEVFECLTIPGLENDALSVLKSFINGAGREFERFYLASAGNSQTGNTILRLIGKSHTGDSTAFLFSRLWSNSRQVKEIVLQNLLEAEFKPSSEDRDRLHQLISDVIGIMVWNLAARICLDKSGDTYLREIINSEYERWKVFLFNLLSITYDRGSISKISENLSSDTVESVNYALEMIDIVIDDTIKPKLVALLDITADEEKIKNLFHFYPGEIAQYNNLVDDILNRDYNLLSVWTKACTLRHLKEISSDSMAESIIALLFSPELMLREESAKAISRLNPELYIRVSRRIPASSRRYLDKIIKGEGRDEDLVFEKAEFLSKSFNCSTKEELVPLAESLLYLTGAELGTSVLPEGIVLWKLQDNNNITQPSLYYSGYLVRNEVNPGAVDKFYVLSFKALEEYQQQYPENSEEIFNCIGKYED